VTPPQWGRPWQFTGQPSESASCSVGGSLNLTPGSLVSLPHDHRRRRPRTASTERL